MALRDKIAMAIHLIFIFPCKPLYRYRDFPFVRFSASDIQFEQSLEQDVGSVIDIIGF